MVLSILKKAPHWLIPSLAINSIVYTADVSHLSCLILDARTGGKVRQTEILEAVIARVQYPENIDTLLKSHLSELKADQTRQKILAIAESQDFFSETLEYKSCVNKCGDFTRRYAAALRKAGFNVLEVGTEVNTDVPLTGFLNSTVMHSFLFVKENGKIYLVDPTVHQFLSSYRGVYVGSYGELFSLAIAENPNRNWLETWSANPVRNAQPLAKPMPEEQERFLAEWGDTGTQVYRDYVPDIAKWAIEQEKAGYRWANTQWWDMPYIKRIEEEMKRLRE